LFRSAKGHAAMKIPLPSGRTSALLSLAAGATIAAAASYEVFCPRATLFGRVVTHGPRNRHAVAILFDRSPNPSTEDVCRRLHELGASATFFLEGNRARRHQTASRAMKSFEIGIHGMHYRPLALRSEKTVRKEIQQACLAARELQDRRISFLLPPHGWKDLRLTSVARELGLTVVNPSCTIRPGEAVTEGLLDRIRPGHLCLVPWRADLPSSVPVVNALTDLVTGLRARGLAPWGLSALLVGP